MTCYSLREGGREGGRGERGCATLHWLQAAVRMRYHSLVLWWVVCHVSVSVLYRRVRTVLYIHSAEPILCRVDTVGQSVSAGAY